MKKIILDKLKSGNGTALVGTMMMVITVTCMLMLSQNALTYQKALSTQTAVDSISDSAAIRAYMRPRGEYTDTVSDIQELVDLVKTHLGIDLHNVASDSGKFDENQVYVSAETSNPYYNAHLGTTPVLITRDSTTEFKKNTSFGDEYLIWMASIALDDRIGYSQESRDLRYGYDTDCSGLVYFALGCTGYYVPGGEWDTGSMISEGQAAGFQFIPISAVSPATLMPGDIFVYPKPAENISGHTETVYFIDGDNLITIGAHGNMDGVTGDSSGNEVSFVERSASAYIVSTPWAGILRPTESTPRKPQSEWMHVLAEGGR